MVKQITSDMSPRLPDFQTCGLSSSAWHGVTGSHAHSHHTHLPASRLGLAAHIWLNCGMQADVKCRCADVRHRLGEGSQDGITNSLKPLYLQGKFGVIVLFFFFEAEARPDL